jgi:CRISPR-associated protein Cmr2
VPEVIEREHAGRLIYAGGDDVLAMLPVADLIPAMQRLRRVYSGQDPLPPDNHTPISSPSIIKSA